MLMSVKISEVISATMFQHKVHKTKEVTNLLLGLGGIRHKYILETNTNLQHIQL